MFTRYWSLTDSELLELVEHSRTKSPILEAITQRFELYIQKSRPFDFKTECLACEAELEITYTGDGSVKLEFPQQPYITNLL